MPTAPPHACPVRGCGRPTTTDRCEIHGANAPTHGWSTNRRQDVKRSIVGRGLHKARLALFVKAMAMCQVCRRPLRDPSEMIRDHVVPLAEGGPDIESNTQALCKNCDRVKTQSEARRGRR